MESFYFLTLLCTAIMLNFLPLNHLLCKMKGPGTFIRFQQNAVPWTFTYFNEICYKRNVYQACRGFKPAFGILVMRHCSTTIQNLSTLDPFPNAFACLVFRIRRLYSTFPMASYSLSILVPHTTYRSSIRCSVPFKAKLLALPSIRSH